MTVGRSDSRTPGKHNLLNKLLGREAGMIRHADFLSDPWVIIDLCAGDGRNDDASGTCSPTIILRHATHHREKNHGRVGTIFLERSRATFDVLVKNVGFHPDNHCIHADARDPWVVPTYWAEKSPVFVHNDPNNINGFALSDNLVSRLPRYTTTLSTLGCNVGGLKRLERSERQLWFEHVGRIVQLMPGHHDGVLIALNGDDSQWAYLLTGPAIWRDRYANDVDSAFKDWPKGITRRWFRDDRVGFNELCADLFFTRTEKKSA